MTAWPVSRPATSDSAGAPVASDGVVTVYYGAADECTCAATTTVDELLKSVG